MRKAFLLLLVVAVAIAAPMVTGQIIYKEKAEKKTQNVFLPTDGNEREVLPIESAAVLAVSLLAVGGYAVNAYLKSRNPVAIGKITETKPIANAIVPKTKATRKGISLTELESQGLFESVDPTQRPSHTGVRKDEA